MLAEVRFFCFFLLDRSAAAAAAVGGKNWRCSARIGDGVYCTRFGCGGGALCFCSVGLCAAVGGERGGGDRDRA